LSVTIRFTTKRCLLSSGPYKSGNTLLKVLSTSSKSGWTIRIWSISCQQNNSITGRPDGHSISPALISSFITGLANLWANPMHFPEEQTMGPAQMITLISRC
jgi:hypothetical protein